MSALLPTDDHKIPEKGLELYEIDGDFEHAEDGGLMFVNQEFMANQRAIIWEFMKSVGKNLFSGSIFKISMPVGLCEGRSFLERIPDQWAYLPYYLGKAAIETDPVQRLKYIVAMSVAGLHYTCRMDKPFNPVLGETYQGVFSDGTEVFLEQTSHHPPVSSWVILGPNNSYKFSGSGVPVAKFKANSMVVGINAQNLIEFADGSKIHFQFPKFSINGVVMGNRILEYFGNWIFYDETNHLVCKLDFTDNSQNKGGFFSTKKITHKSDYFSGIISAGTVTFGEFDDESTGNATVELTGSPLSTLKGSWIDYVDFDDEKIWVRQEHKPKAEVPTAPKKLLPSDSRFRSDSKAVRDKDWVVAEKEKLKLEETQRRDRKLREQHNGKEH
eukprot:TRINITY_DN80015_c0_g1_i1.p1 TRINITY_DN80015_c0_g1~~TRINITY_DN80015_c0_g1_i1.p1  ORF type:complete len:385 (+),score=110.41 TRINITY_DN80015_c0_g1_i1:70-1224(+)